MKKKAKKIENDILNERMDIQDNKGNEDDIEIVTNDDPCEREKNISEGRNDQENKLSITRDQLRSEQEQDESLNKVRIYAN